MNEQKTNTERSMLEELLRELQQHVGADEGDVFHKRTKGQALIKSMVNEALKGDQKMLANVLKFIEKLDALQNGKRDETQQTCRWKKKDWEMYFHFIWRYKAHIELELARMQAENPGAFKGEWADVKPKQAPWYEAIYGK